MNSNNNGNNNGGGNGNKNCVNTNSNNFNASQQHQQTPSHQSSPATNDGTPVSDVSGGGGGQQTVFNLIFNLKTSRLPI